MFGGYWAFGDNKDISGSVNNQIVLYLFARGIQGALISGVKRGIIPQSMDISKPHGTKSLFESV
jgi:peroxisomal membrane protein 4